MMPRTSPLFFNLPFLPLNGADGETRTLAGQCAWQFTKLLLSLLSHIGGLNAEKFPTRSADLFLHSAFILLPSQAGSPRIRTVFSPVKSRDFTIKVCNPK